VSEEEKEAIEIVKEITFVRGIRKDVEGEEKDLCALEILLNYIDKLQKQLDQLKEVDRQICCEELITKDKYQDILKENEELSKSNFHFLEINQKLIEEKPIIKELAEKELNLLEKIDKLQRDSISKDIIRNKIKELEEKIELIKQRKDNIKNGMAIIVCEYVVEVLEELLGE
jgi:hypothetical protein